MKILVERDNFEEPKAGDIVQTNIGVCMKTYAGYVSLEGDNIGELNCDCDVKVSKVLIKSEDVVISEAQKEEVKEEIYEVEKPEKTEDNSKTKYKDEFFISENFIKFIGKLTGNDIKNIFKVDDSTEMADCLNDLVYGIYTIYYNHRDKIDDSEFMTNELKNMIYDFFHFLAKRINRTDKMLFDCIDYFKNLKAEDISEIYCNLFREHFLSGIQFGSLESVVYYFNKIGRLVEIGRIEYFYDNI